MKHGALELSRGKFESPCFVSISWRFKNIINNNYRSTWLRNKKVEMFVLQKYFFDILNTYCFSKVVASFWSRIFNQRLV